MVGEAELKRFSSVNQHDDDAPLEENGDAIIGAGAPKDRVRVAVAAAERNIRFTLVDMGMQ